MRKEYNLSGIEWTLTGYTPYIWKYEGTLTAKTFKSVDTGPVKARVPGSVQMALLDAGVIEDWNVGDNSKKCEWVENRHWIYSTVIPDEWIGSGDQLYLKCMGLDYSGWIFVNGCEIADFKGTHIPHIFNLTDKMRGSGNILAIVFDVPPRWLGQFGYTSKMTEWKTRFNYTWDWVPRLVQVGIWDSISLVTSDGERFGDFRCIVDADVASQTGKIYLKSEILGIKADKIKCTLKSEGKSTAEEEITVSEIQNGITIEIPEVRLWWPNLEGRQPLYDLDCLLIDEKGNIIDKISRRIGFRNVIWIPCEGAPEEADPWLCVVNGKPVFLQGFNFQPIRPNYADLKKEDYEKRLKNYRDIGTNFLRVNACGFLEYECFYELCDEMGIMVWQEFPLTSSGIENWPSEEEKHIDEMCEIAVSFIARRQHHASLILWSGGNELMGSLDGNKTGTGKPCGLDHPMLGRLNGIVLRDDPARRYIPTSPSGPRASTYEMEFGKGVYWDVHGPNADFETEEKLMDFWEHDDALFRSEIYVSGANPVESIRKYIGKFSEMPASLENPYWQKPTRWWNDWDVLCKKYGREPENLEEYVAWSQKKQAERLAYAMKKCKERFPKIGGTLMWGSHETFPLPINTTVLDFDGNPKPAAFALAEVWRK